MHCLLSRISLAWSRLLDCHSGCHTSHQSRYDLPQRRSDQEQVEGDWSMPLHQRAFYRRAGVHGHLCKHSRMVSIQDLNVVVCPPYLETDPVLAPVVTMKRGKIICLDRGHTYLFRPCHPKCPPNWKQSPHCLYQTYLCIVPMQPSYKHEDI